MRRKPPPLASFLFPCLAGVALDLISYSPTIIWVIHLSQRYASWELVPSLRCYGKVMDSLAGGASECPVGHWGAFKGAIGTLVPSWVCLCFWTTCFPGHSPPLPSVSLTAWSTGDTRAGLETSRERITTSLSCLGCASQLFRHRRGKLNNIRPLSYFSHCLIFSNKHLFII